MCIRDRLVASELTTNALTSRLAAQLDDPIEVEVARVRNTVLLSVVDTAPVSYTHLRAHETVLDLVCRLLLEKKKTPPIPDLTNCSHIY